MIEFLRKLADWCGFFRCPLCDENSGRGQNELCPECREKLPLLKVSGHCRGCGGVNDNALAVCSSCLQYPQRPWHDALSVMEYRGEGRKLIQEFKFHNHPELARSLGLAGAAAVKDANLEFDVVIPVPLHWTRLWRRTYNQAELFGAIVAAECGKPLIRGLRRLERGGKQAKLDRQGRRKNARHLFAPCNVEKFQGKKVLLVDDIITTGATLEAAAKILLKRGAAEVNILTAARTPLRGGR